MVNLLRLMGALGQPIERRDTSIATYGIGVTTTDTRDPSSTALVTYSVYGYQTSYTIISSGYTYVSVASYPTSTSTATVVKPLTTSFTPAASCVSELSAYANNPAYLPGSIPLLALPGFCPSGYSIDTTSIYQPAGSVTETAGNCCPTGYQYSASQCHSFINNKPNLKSSASTAPRVGPPFTVTVHYTSIATSTTGTIPLASQAPLSETTLLSGSVDASLIAWPVNIRWQSTDQQVLSWIAQQSGNASSTKPPPASVKKKKSSAGVIAGAVIGALAFLALSILAVVLLCRRARKNKPFTQAEEAAYETAEVGTGYGGGHQINTLATAYPPENTYRPESAKPPIAAVSTRGVSSNIVGSPPQHSEAYQNYPNNTYYPIMSEMPAEARPVSQRDNRLPELSGENRPMSRISDNLSEQSAARATESPSHSAVTHYEGSPQAAHSLLSGSQPVAFPSTPVDRTSVSSSATDAISPSTNSNINALREQQNRIREERARLSRLQELSDMDSRLEQQLEEELKRERSP
ncbi:hypothetical protein BT63DRAFT_476919 [Microthyrium microscopicum]|uniref:Uncharacterized protein n=1 Tax=Microthyrium microscopicum TaxID=703497 RepID=A0A6A6UII8_9PEZI|nr:hypothetical protein BT63DRAFT_476919 [Microthyrium microscopicum]